MFPTLAAASTATLTTVFAATISTTNARAEPFADVGRTDAELTSRGLHGYIASRAERVPSEFHYGAGFYATVWPLIAQPIANFQIGLPSTWILPDNSDNTTEPLCPPGTLPRDSWPERDRKSVV